MGRMLEDVLKIGSSAIFASGVTWLSQAWAHRAKVKRDTINHSDRLEIHRDELTFELLQGARAEMAFARAEIEALRKEVNTLRDLERHIYHFQQSLDHLETILTATTEDEKTVAERNARAFLNRMRRLNEAKGTIANEVQAVDSEIALKERGITLVRDSGDVSKI